MHFPVAYRATHMIRHRQVDRWQAGRQAMSLKAAHGLLGRLTTRCTYKSETALYLIVRLFVLCARGDLEEAGVARAYQQQR